MLCKGRVWATSQPPLCCVCESVCVARAASDSTGWSLHALSHVCHVTVCLSVCLCELLLWSLRQSDRGKVPSEATCMPGTGLPYYLTRVRLRFYGSKLSHF